MKNKFVVMLLFVVFCAFSAFAKSDKTYDELKLLVDILSYAQDNYVDEINTKEMIYSAASGMMKSLDPYSQFLPPEPYKEMKIDTEGKYGGLGIRISIRDEWLTVITPIIDSPAYKLGILPGDKIIKIDDVSTQGITIEGAVKKLRGDPGTKVKLSVFRKDVKDPIDYTVTREIIRVKSIDSKMIEDYGYIHLYEFNRNSMEDMNKELTSLKSKNIKGLVFDLRNNPGGLLDVAVDVSKLFVGGEKMIVYTKGRIPQSNNEYHAGKNAPYGALPLVVLTNYGSASGSEIVAGALKDNKRAVIVGSHTFGKASVQTVIPLSDGCGLKLTTAKYYTPSGKLIQQDKTGKGGIDPDIKIELSPDAEAKLYQQQEIVYPPGKEPAKDEDKKDKVEDTALNRALEVLKMREILIQTGN